MRESLLDEGHGLVVPTQMEVCFRSILKSIPVLWVEPHCLHSVSQSLLVIPLAVVAQRQVVPGNRFARIDLLPLLVDLDGFFRFAGHSFVIMGIDVKLFALARAAPELECLGDARDLIAYLTEVAVHCSKRGVSNGKVRIKFRRTP